jgi:hypothetical protein
VNHRLNGSPVTMRCLKRSELSPGQINARAGPRWALRPSRPKRKSPRRWDIPRDSGGQFVN